jgi:uncharacterized membrane protein (UPF0127 family)
MSLTVAITDEAQERGFTGRDDVADDELMLFPDVAGHEFHMRGVKCQLTIAALDRYLRVVAYTVAEPETGRFAVPAGASLVLEAGAGLAHELQVGAVPVGLCGLAWWPESSMPNQAKVLDDIHRRWDQVQAAVDELRRKQAAGSLSALDLATEIKALADQAAELQTDLAGKLTGDVGLLATTPEPPPTSQETLLAIMKRRERAAEPEFQAAKKESLL